MLGTSHIASHKAAAYATGADFCRIFRDDVNRLYTLSFLLTADSAAAEKCFVQGLEDSKKGNPVFKEWAESWARRTVVANAIRTVRPRPERNVVSRKSSQCAEAMTMREEIAAIIVLPAFERFAFVMSVLEGYSDRECSLLLNCAGGELVAARTRALQEIGNPAEFSSKLAAIGSARQALPDEHGLAIPTVIIFQLAASA